MRSSIMLLLELSYWEHEMWGAEKGGEQVWEWLHKLTSKLATRAALGNLSSRTTKLKLALANSGALSFMSNTATTTGIDALRGWLVMSWATIVRKYMSLSSLSRETCATSLPVVTTGGRAVREVVGRMTLTTSTRNLDKEIVNMHSLLNQLHYGGAWVWCPWYHAHDQLTEA